MDNHKLRTELERAELSLKEMIACGDVAATETAIRQLARLDVPSHLKAAAEALHRSSLKEADAILREHLREVPSDARALAMLSEVLAAIGDHVGAERLLFRSLECEPEFVRGRYMLAMLLRASRRAEDALVQLDKLLEREPENPAYRNMMAQLQIQFGNYDSAIVIYQEMLEKCPRQPMIWKNFGHVLRTVGRVEESISAYRQALNSDHEVGEAWYSLANLKSFHFSDTDIERMYQHLRREDSSSENRLLIEFALGKALEDKSQYAESFEHYARGNALQRKIVSYSADNNTKRIRWLKKNQQHSFFAEREGAGCDAQDPIFIVGMTRAGSTLLEQMLSSHSQIEGTMELPALMQVASEINIRLNRPKGIPYEQLLPGMDRNALRALGDRYLKLARAYRKRDRPFFIDKLPENFLRTGMIHLILPNAKIIDARRHPMACGFSNFKQNFSSGRGQNYSLEDIGRYYCDYVELMAHYDAVLPGRVCRVIYEQMVDDAESELCRLLSYCGLEFEEKCLRFFENDRAVRTPSAQQVRRPIYQSGVGQWQNYEQWLQPLKDSLGDVLKAYPESPRFNG